MIRTLAACLAAMGLAAGWLAAAGGTGPALSIYAHAQAGEPLAVALAALALAGLLFALIRRRAQHLALIAFAMGFLVGEITSELTGPEPLFPRVMAERGVF